MRVLLTYSESGGGGRGGKFCENSVCREGDTDLSLLVDRDSANSGLNCLFVDQLIVPPEVSDKRVVSAEISWFRSRGSGGGSML